MGKSIRSIMDITEEDLPPYYHQHKNDDPHAASITPLRYRQTDNPIHNYSDLFGRITLAQAAKGLKTAVGIIAAAYIAKKLLSKKHKNAY